MARYQDVEWQMQNSLRLDVNYMMEDFLGSGEGVSVQEIENMLPVIDQAIGEMKHKRPQMAWRDLPYNQQEVVEQVADFAQTARKRYSNVVVLGIGGSALGPLAVHQALNHPFYNQLEHKQRGGFPKFYVLDNVDPDRFSALLDVVNPAETLFNVITKSGSTSETMAQFMIVRKLLQELLGENYYRHLVATTDFEKGSLVNIARQEGYQLFYIPQGVGGRFSQLSPVGLLPAALTGLDIEEMLAGAAFMDRWIEGSLLWENPAYLRASLNHISLGKGKNISVMMPYGESLKYLADWYAQLWAESLGKRINNLGEEVFVGQTPVKALGVTDQHSQVQLYTEGPFDKIVNFLAVESFRNEVAIPEDFSAIAGLAFLGGHTLNELMAAELQATEYALYKARRMNNTIILPKVNEFSLGQLIYLLEVETAFAGELLNINAFDQPGVEEGKNATYALMGRPGFEQKKAELQSSRAKLDHYILSQTFAKPGSQQL